MIVGMLGSGVLALSAPGGAMLARCPAPRSSYGTPIQAISTKLLQKLQALTCLKFHCRWYAYQGEQVITNIHFIFKNYSNLC